MDNGNFNGQIPPAAEQSAVPQPIAPLGGIAVVSAEAAKKDQKKLKILLIVAGVAALILLVTTLVFVAQWQTARSDVDGQIAVAVSAAKAQQEADSDAYWQEQMKSPMLKFEGPADYGSLQFDYPKTWSLYVAKDANRGGDFEAYLNPRVVQPVSATAQFALRVVIYDKAYGDVIKQYDQQLKKGELKAMSFVVAREGAPTVTGVRYEGLFAKEFQATGVFFKLRDKTVMIRTDGDGYVGDFDALIQTIDFRD
jgi:hypothetical protein